MKMYKFFIVVDDSLCLNREVFLSVDVRFGITGWFVNANVGAINRACKSIFLSISAFSLPIIIISSFAFLYFITQSYRYITNDSWESVLLSKILFSSASFLRGGKMYYTGTQSNEKFHYTTYYRK